MDVFEPMHANIRTDFVEKKLKAKVVGQPFPRGNLHNWGRIMQTYRYSCDHCFYLIETSGPWPYYKQKKEKVQYENFMDASSGPIHGLRAQVYCPSCDKKKEYPIVEYEKPLPNLCGIWWTDIPRKIKLTCHRCKGPVYLILPPGEVKCPKCKKGTFDLYEPMPREEPECFPVPPPVSPLRIRQGGKPVRIPEAHRRHRFGRALGVYLRPVYELVLGIGSKEVEGWDYTILGDGG